MSAEVTNRQRKVRLDVAELRRRARAMLELAGAAQSEWAITLVSDARIRELNQRWRGKDAPTDVLSFPLEEMTPGAPPPAHLGDVVISAETAARQAADRAAELSPTGDASYDVLDEITFLMAHGLLHLLGHDHEDPAEARRMQAEERRLCAPFLAVSPRAHL